MQACCWVCGRNDDACVVISPAGRTVFHGMFLINEYTHFIKLLLLLGTGGALLISMGYFTKEGKKNRHSEYPVLILLSAVGMMVMVSSNSLILLYLGLELQSLCLYVLASIKRAELKSSEAGLKYFILGALASGLFLFGASLIYGFTGTVNFSDLASLSTNFVSGEASPCDTFRIFAYCCKLLL